MSRSQKQKGFTLVELIIILAVFGTLIGLMFIPLLSSYHSTNIRAIASVFIADMREQQIKAMEGDSEGRGTADTYGIYVEPTGYVLFHGASYTPGDSTNYTIIFEPNIRFSVAKTIIFSRIDGVVSGMSTATDSVLLQDISANKQTQITFNKLGVVTAVDNQ